MRKSGKMTNAAVRQPGNLRVTGLQAEIKFQEGEDISQLRKAKLADTEE